MVYLLKTLFYIDVVIAAGLLVFRWALADRYRAVVSAKLSAIVLITPIIALFSGNIYVLYVYLALAVAFTSRSRRDVAGVFLFLLPSVPILGVQMYVAGAYLFPFTTVAAMGAGALAGMVVTRPLGPRTPLRYDVAVWFLIVLFVFTDTRFDSGTMMLRSFVSQTLLLLAPYLLVKRAARNVADIESLMLTWTFGAAIMALTACFQAARHWVLYEAYNQTLHVPILHTSAATAMRAGMLQSGGSMVNYSAGGLLLAGAVVALPFLRRCFRLPGYYGVMAILVGGLGATQSRGAWAAAVVGWAATALWQRRYGRLILVAGGAAFVQLLADLLPTGSRLAEMLGKSGHAQETAGYRRDLLAQGMDQVRAHPLLGQPSGRLVQNLSDLTQGQHIVDFVNSHLYIAMTTGVPLFLVWCAMWLMPVVDGFRRHRAPLFGVPIAIIVTAFVALVFTSLIDRNMTWVTVAMAFSASAIAIVRTSRCATMPPPPPADYERHNLGDAAATFAPTPASPGRWGGLTAGVASRRIEAIRQHSGAAR